MKNKEMVFVLFAVLFMHGAIVLSSNFDEQDQLNWDLLEAVRLGDITYAEQLLNAGANLDRPNNVLLNAMRLRTSDMLNLLLRAEAKVNREDSGENAAIIEAVRDSYITVEKLQILLDAEADPDTKAVRGSYSGETAKMLTDKVPRYLEDEDNVKAQAEAISLVGETALMIASQMGALAKVQALLKAGANVNMRNNAGQTALFHAVRSDSVDVVQELLKAGAEINIKDHKGQTPFQKKEFFVTGLSLMREGRNNPVDELIEKLLLGVEPTLQVEKK